MSLPTGFVVLGAPGCGKTRLALALADALAEMGVAAFVLHTDLLKVTLRSQGVDGLEGPSYLGDTVARVSIIASVLEAQWAKARADGYTLIVEGTLAFGFYPTDAVVVLLEADAELRRERMMLKHRSAREALVMHTEQVERFAHDLASHVPEYAERIDAAAAVEASVETLLARNRVRLTR